MSLLQLDHCVQSGTEHLPTCERNCGRMACTPWPRAARAPAPERPLVQRFVRAWRISRAEQHLHQLERYYAHCERGGNCTAAELQTERLRVHDARIALAIAYRSAP